MFPGDHIITIRNRQSRMAVRFVGCEFLGRYVYAYGKAENIIGQTVCSLTGVCTAGERQASSKGGTSRASLRCNTPRSVSRGRGRIFHELTAPHSTSLPLQRVMDNSKKNASPTAASQEAKRAPEKQFTAGNVSASVFAREYNGKVFRNYSVTRWYRDKKGESKYVNSYGPDDSANAIKVHQQADEYCRSMDA